LDIILVSFKVGKNGWVGDCFVIKNNLLPGLYIFYFERKAWKEFDAHVAAFGLMILFIEIQKDLAGEGFVVSSFGIAYGNLLTKSKKEKK
jgi:hypothetical protein